MEPLDRAISAEDDGLLNLQKAVQEHYPDLRLLIHNGKPFFRGSFPVMHDGQILDRFLIEIAFPGGTTKPPLIRETGGRIPRIADRHVFSNGAICTEVPELTLLRRGYSLRSYLDGPVHNYFIGQALVDRGEGWPFGEWSHGKPGLLEAYGGVLGVDDEQRIRKYLQCLSHKKIRAHSKCPCGSGRLVRDCHTMRMRELHENIPPWIARQALERLGPN